MIEEEDNRTDGGSVSAETEAEFRDDNPRGSAPLSREDGDGISSGTVERRSRDEVVNRYRNDPRFNVLFKENVEEKVVKKKKKAAARTRSVKVGGIRLTPKRLLILGGFFLVVLCCLGVCLFFAFKDIGKYKNYSRATELFKSGDYESAKQLYLKVIADDPNKEGALAALAEIYNLSGDWNNESFFRQRLMRLNPLNEEYYHDFLKSAFRARNFGVIYSLLNLKLMDHAELSPELGALFVISALYTRHESNAKDFFALRKKEDPGYFSDNEYGRFAEMLLNVGDMTIEQVQQLLVSLDEIKDSQVRFETINMLLYFLSKRNDANSEAEMEKLLRDATKLNNYAGAPLLADFYFSRYRFNETIDVCEEFFKTKMNAFMPVLYGDSCVLSGRPELLAPLIEKIRPLLGRQSGILVSYLEALKVFSEEDYTHLRTLLMNAGNSIRTPLFELMMLQVGLQSDSPKEIRQTLGAIMKGQPFLDFQERARSAALNYLMRKITPDILSDPDLLNDCSEIALLIQTPDDDNSFFKRIVLLDHFTRNVLKEEEIQNALSTYQGDIVLLWIAAEFYLRNGQPARAMECITEYNEHPDVPGKSSIAILHIRALNQLGRKIEAEEEFRSIVENDDPDGLLLPYYYEFCAENGFVDSLKALSDWLEALPKDSEKRDALPFVRAEILLSEGNEKQALDLFEKSTAANPRFTFHAGVRLAEAGRTDAALARYRSIQDTFPDKSLLNIRLSELYTVKGDAKSALACARAAWQERPEDLEARQIYGKCLVAAGQYADAISVLKFPQYRAFFPDEMVELWAEAMREQIKSDFSNARYVPVRENLKHLLIYLPEDKFALEYERRMEILRRQSKKIGEDL